MTALLLASLLLPPGADPSPPVPPVPWWMPYKSDDFARMLHAVRTDSMRGAGTGWFGPSESRYGWAWLAARHGRTPANDLPRDTFRGPAAVFAALDRDKDGVLRADDFDWSDAAAFVRRTAQARQWFDRADGNADRKLSKVEWDALFEKASNGKSHLTPDDARALLFPPPPRPSGPSPGMPSRATLLAGLFAHEIGSPYPGPKLESVAPDFTLSTQDGKRTVTLSDYRGKKPVVLIFGSFT